MTAYLHHHLVNGYIHNWLVAGPRVHAIQNMKHSAGEDENGLLQVYQDLPQDDRTAMLDLTTPPLEMVEFEVNGASLAWRYLRCLDDHLVDLTAFFPLWNYLSAWAYTVIKLPSAHKATLILTTHGPADLWLNGRHVHRHEDFHLHELHGQSVEMDLVEGENQVQVRFEMVGVRECPFRLALRVLGLPQEMDEEDIILVPTQARYPQRHEAIEEIFEKAYLEEVVNHRGAHFNLRWAEDMGPKMKFAYNIQDKDGWQYLEGNWETDKEEPVDVGHTYRLKERQYFVALRPILLEYFEHNLRYEKKLPIYVTDNPYASVPSGTLAERIREALEDAAKYDANLYAELAKLGLGRWSEFNPGQVMEAIQKVNQREAGSQVLLIGLLGMMARYMKNPNFPEKLHQPLKECVLHFRYWQDEDLAVNGKNEGLDFHTESDSLIFHACEVLAGQLYPRHTFSNSGHKGSWQRKTGEILALDWLRLRGTHGFQEWDSNEGYEKDLLALSHLTSLAEDSTLREMAAVMMDKIFFNMAVNSFKGSFGSSHGSTHAFMLKSSQLEATSGISRMMWGMGVFNSHILGTVSLAASSYEFPLLIGEIANDVTRKMWIHERHIVNHEKGIEVNKVTYKTPDYMLCSAQDYRPGEPGKTEHIWQATLGSEAVVFTNHPASITDKEEHRPGFWLGNRSLPRVAQWKDVLVALYQLPEADWLGFTHAYFPIYSFSEYEIKTDNRIRRTWAFARKDIGFLALTASQGFELVKRAPDGYRELRSYGRNNAWLCHMGSAETDGSFENFKKRILAMKLNMDGLDIRCRTLREELLTFGWESALKIDGKEKALHGFKHHESPYSVVDLPATQMEIQLNDLGMRLDFS